MEPFRPYHRVAELSEQSTQDAWVKDTFGFDVSAAEQGTGTEAEQGEASEEQVGGWLDDLKGKVKKLFADPEPPPRAALGGAQTSRADKLKKGMSEEDQKKVDKVLSEAKSIEKDYLIKALASSHSAKELEDFYQEIKGKDIAWMENNLHVVGDTKGKGVKQQWQMSCAPTSVQAIKAELDPVYALKLRKENPNLEGADDSDGGKLNPKLAQEQSDMLLSKGAVATNRGVSGKGLSVKGVEDLFNATKGETGVKYDTKKIDDTDMDTSLDEMGKSITSGLPVPLLVGKSGGPGHAVLMTGFDAGPPRLYSIHDPYDGKTITVTDKQIKSKKLDIAGWPEITHFLQPAADAGP